MSPLFTLATSVGESSRLFSRALPFAAPGLSGAPGAAVPAPEDAGDAGLPPWQAARARQATAIQMANREGNRVNKDLPCFSTRTLQHLIFMPFEIDGLLL
jgi:hypothetical protein